MNSKLIDTIVFSRKPGDRNKTWQQLVYAGDTIGGMITHDVKIKGDNVFIPITSYCTGKCTLEDVKIPYGTAIISLSIHNDHHSVGEIGDYKLVKEFRIARGVYCSGLLVADDYITLKRKLIIGYDLKIFGRSKLTLNRYIQTQRKAK